MPLRVPQENGEWLNIDDEIERIAGGGGSQPITRASYGITDGGSWSLTAGDALLVLTDPTNPAPVASGVYAVTVVVKATNGTGGVAVCSGELTIDSDNFFAQASSALSMPDSTTAWLPVPLTFYCPAGSPILFSIGSTNPAVVDRIDATVQRLS